MQKAIEIYTNPDVAAHVTADMQGYSNYAKLNYISRIIRGLECVRLDNNNIRLFKGLFSNQGRELMVVPGTVEDFVITSGSLGLNRHDSARDDSVYVRIGEIRHIGGEYRFD